MDPATRVRAIISAALLVEFAESRGMDRSAMLRGTGIPDSRLSDPGAEVTLAQELRLMRNIVTALDDEPGMGFLAGLLCHPPSLGILGFAVMSSPSVRYAAELALRYADLSFTIAGHHMEEHGDEVRIIRHERDVPPELRRFGIERDVAAIATIQQDLLPVRLATVRAELATDPHPLYETFGALLGIPEIVFGVERSMLVVPVSTLNLQLPHASNATARFYEQQCAELLQQRRRRTGISGRVRELLIRHGRVAGQSHIAADLGVGVRTLRRRLADEGTTFRELSSETVGMLAEELLLAGLTVENVADRLGYSSVSAFTAAFRSWKGQSPGEFARLRRGRSTVRV